MIRLVAVSRAIREVVPPELVPVFWVVTLLGSAKFLVLALSLAYWNLPDRRDDVLGLVSVAFVALTVTLVLKYGFDLPRPPVDVQRYPVETSDVGFPSGHAIAATVVYGGAAVATDRHRNHRAALAVAAVVAAIALSRVVLGVHYLGDVVAGVGVGLLVLGAVALVLDRGAAWFFGAAAVLSLPALAVSGGDPDAALALGGSLGGLVGTVVRPGSLPGGSRRDRAVLTAVGLAFVGALLLAGELAEGVLPATAALYFLLALGVVVLPAVVARLVESETDR